MVVCMPVPFTRLSWDPTPRETPMRPLTRFAVLLATLAACHDSASLEVKVPAERFDEALAGLAPIGKLESVNVNAEDVGEEFTDVTARVENARRLESRLIQLLATRTGKLKDVLDVEQELARVREEIDRYEGRLRYLRAHAALSTFTIYVHEPLPIVR